MARKVFYSFHYNPDNWRASQVRNIGAIEGNQPAKDNDWETITKGGDKAIEKWIADQMSGRSCVVVLIGAGTANRKWINHEIVKGWNDGKGVLGIYVHNLKNSEGKTSSKGSNQRQHYCIFRKVRQLNGQSAADFEYEQRKQELAIEDLKRFNVKTLLVDEYADITAILRRIDDSYRRKTVFVSGSAHSFGQWTEFEAEEFMRDLGQMIVQKGFNLVSGLGLGVAAPLISGAVEAVYKGRSGRIHDQLIVRPFPRHIEDDATRARVWEEFRQDLISQAGVALFLFGNKKVGEEVVDADGVRKEYEIAQKNGLLLAPIGGTGFVAKALWEEQRASQRGLAVPAGFVGALEKLGDEPGKLGELLEQIKELLNHVEN